MIPVNEDQFIMTLIGTVEAQIIVYNEAIIAVSVGGHASYSFDDGQTRQTVTRHSLREYQNILDGLLNRRATLFAMLGHRSAYVRPGY